MVTASRSPRPAVKGLRERVCPPRVVGMGVGAVGLLVASAASAVPVQETPWEILGQRGMPLALLTIAGGLALLWTVSTPGERAEERRPQAPIRDRWGHVALFVGAIYLPIAYGPAIVNALVQLLGGPGVFRRAVNGLGALVGLTVAGIMLRRPRPLRAYLAFAGLLALYVPSFSLLEVTVKRIHFLEYSCLSLLTDRALRPRVLPPMRHLWILLLALGVGAVEEGIEVFLPRRFGTVSDVLFDVAGGTLGALFVKFVLRAG